MVNILLSVSYVHEGFSLRTPTIKVFISAQDSLSVIFSPESDLESKLDYKSLTGSFLDCESSPKSGTNLNATLITASCISKMLLSNSEEFCSYWN